MLDLTNLENIEAFPKPPWVSPVIVSIPEKAEAMKLASLPAGGKRKGSSIQFTLLAIKSEIFRLSTSTSPIHDY